MSTGKDRPDREKINAYQRAWYAANKDRVIARSLAYREANRDKVAAQKHAWYVANRDKIAAQHRAYRKANRDKINAKQRAWCEENKDKAVAYRRAYREANRDKINARQKAWRDTNQGKIATYQKSYAEANRDKINARQRSRYNAARDKEISSGQDGLPRTHKNIYLTANGTYTVYFARGGQRYYAGTHKTIDDAIAARDAKLKELEDQHD